MSDGYNASRMVFGLLLQRKEEVRLLIGEIDYPCLSNEMMLPESNYAISIT